MRPAYSVSVERNMVIEWDIIEHIESERANGKFASLLTARHAAAARLAQGVGEHDRVVIRDSRYEVEHGYHSGWIGRAYKPLTSRALQDKR